MIKCYGDKPSFDLPEYDKDVSIIFDFTDVLSQQDLTQLNPEDTYIVTSKPLVDILETVTLGFYNVLSDTGIEDLTETSLIKFLKSPYAINKCRVESQSLIALHSQKGKTITHLKTMLESLADGDVASFVNNVIPNLDTMYDSLRDIQLIHILAQSLMNDADLFDNISTYCEQLKDKEDMISELKQKLESLEIIKTDATTELKHSKETIKNLESELSDIKDTHVRKSSVTTLPEYMELDMKNKSLQETIEDLKKENKTLRLTSGIVTDLSDTQCDAKERLIMKLKDDLAQANTKTFKDKISARLPAITNNITMEAEKILYIKEVKTAIYMNTYLHWLTLYLLAKLREERNKDYIIVVFDELVDEFRITKYKKRGWAINEVPLDKSNIVVTNDVSMEFLKETLGIHKYKYVFVIDRLHLTQDIVDTSVTEKYYLVDTPSDVKDFRLNPDRCIAFLSANNTTTQGVFKHIITYDNVNLFTDNHNKKAVKVASDNILTNILKDMGIVENV